MIKHLWQAYRPLEHWACTVACLFAIGLVCSKFIMSISLVLWAIGVISTWDTKRMIDLLKNNRLFLLVLLFYLLHVISLFWSTNLAQGWDDIRVRSTLVVLPFLFMVSFKNKEENYKWVHLITLLCLVVVSAIQLIHFFWIQSNGTMTDVRQLSWFGSHIRFGILLAFSLSIAHLALKKKWISPAIFWFYASWIVFYTIYSQVFSAYLTLFISGGFMVWSTIKTKRAKVFLCGAMVVLVSLGSYLLWAALGPQSHVPCGHFQDQTEASKVWGLQSQFAFKGKDQKNQYLERTLERFLCSEGKTLNAAGIQSLTKEEVSMVERGFTENNHFFFTNRLSEIRFQLYEAKDPNGHSILQRFAYWGAAIHIIKNNLWLGVGVGDIDAAFTKAYLETHSRLLPEYQHRSHNMFLTTYIATGVLGFLILFGILGLLFWMGRKEGQLILIAFSVITLFTFMFEDTIETQTGVSFFAFYLALLAIKPQGISQFN